PTADCTPGVQAIPLLFEAGTFPRECRPLSVSGQGILLDRGRPVAVGAARGRNPENERAAGPRGRVHRRASAVRLDDLAHDREAQPGAAFTRARAPRLAPPEPVEDLLPITGVDARPAVGHGQPQPSVDTS